MNTPKMRGLKQHLISLKLYNNNTFIDGKKLEMSHIIPKWLLKKLNNHKGPLKYFQSKKCLEMFSMIYVMNGGKWGKDWQYSIGNKLLELKHPCKPNEPHPFIADWIIPQPHVSVDKIRITQLHSSHSIKPEFWRKIFKNYTDAQFLNRLKQYFEIDSLTFENVVSGPEWKIRKVRSFHFTDSFKSFQSSFDDTNKRILVKINDTHIMESNILLQITFYQDTVSLMYGTYWPIHVNDSNVEWCNDRHSSMDFIYNNQAKKGWNFLQNITEPVFLIHDCLLLQHAIRLKIPAEFRPQNAYDWVQNMIYYSNRMHEYMANFPQKRLIYPCGPKYSCIKHQKTACMQCTQNKGLYPSNRWKMEWCCNMQNNPKKWILDAKNGLTMTTMKSTTR